MATAAIPFRRTTDRYPLHHARASVVDGEVEAVGVLRQDVKSLRTDLHRHSAIVLMMIVVFGADDRSGENCVGALPDAGAAGNHHITDAVSPAPRKPWVFQVASKGCHYKSQQVIKNNSQVAFFYLRPLSVT